MAEQSLRKTFVAGLWQNNPVLRLLLGMSGAGGNHRTQAGADNGAQCDLVLTCSNVVVSLMKHLLKPHLEF